jgi:hypothetical protein
MLLFLANNFLQMKTFETVIYSMNLFIEYKHQMAP